MHILICPDKFKESLSATQVSEHIRKGLLKALPEAVCKIIPLADGGDGTVEVLVKATGGKIVRVSVHDPLMREIQSYIGLSGDRKIAFIEMAAASGMALLKPGERNPLITTSFGTGELIHHALEQGCRTIIIGIGGSATVDGGVGLAQALGIHFTDDAGTEIGPGGGNLGKIRHIDLSRMEPMLAGCKILTACDVNNILTGEHGAAKVFGPQKGASPSDVEILEDNLTYLAGIVRSEFQIDIQNLQSGGAAGGMGAGIAAFINGELHNGFDLIAQITKLKEHMNWSDLVITGEGKMDNQTAYGKTPAGVARMAVKNRKPVIGITGSLDDDWEKLYEIGFSTVIPITDKPMKLDEAMARAGKLVENTAERIGRMISLGKFLAATQRP